MKYKKLLFDLIDYLDAFESLHDGGSHEPEIKDFADFLSWRCGKKKKQEEEVVSVTRERAAGAKNIARGQPPPSLFPFLYQESSDGISITDRRRIYLSGQPDER